MVAAYLLVTITNSSTNLTNSTLNDNSAIYDGGGIHSGFYAIPATDIAIVDSTLSGNSAGGNGGGVFLGTGVDFTLSHSTIAFNIADNNQDGSGRGGGIYSMSGPSPSLYHVIIAKNRHGVSTPDDIYGAVTANWTLIGTDDGATIDGSNIFLGLIRCWPHWPITAG